MRNLLLIYLLVPLTIAAQVTKDNYQDFLHGEFAISKGGGDETDIHQYLRVELLNDASGHHFIVYGHDNETGRSIADEYTVSLIKPISKAVVTRGFIYCYRLDQNGDTISRNFVYQYLKEEGFLIAYEQKHFTLTRTSPAPNLALSETQTAETEQFTQTQNTQQQANTQQQQQPQQTGNTTVSGQRVTTTQQQPQQTGNTTVSGQRVTTTQQQPQQTSNTTVSGQRVTTTQQQPQQPGNTTVSGQRVTTTQQQPQTTTTLTIEDGRKMLTGGAWSVEDTYHCYVVGHKIKIMENCQPLIFVFHPDEGKTIIVGTANSPSHIAGNRAGKTFHTSCVSKLVFTAPDEGYFTLGNNIATYYFRRLTETSAEFKVSLYDKWVKARRIPLSEVPKTSI